MSADFTPISPNPREHLFLKGRKVPRKELSDHQIYLRKKNSRLKRANAILKEEDRQKFFDWIESIQTKLKLSNTAFANRLGISCQTVKLWKRRVGHYPCERSFKQLIKLEREAKIVIEDIKFIVRIRQR